MQNSHGEERTRRLLELRQQLNDAASPHASPEHDTTEGEAQDGLQPPIIDMDTAGYVTAWNRGAQRLFGYSPEEAIDQHILFLYADDDGEANIHELFDHGSPLIEVKRRKKSGEIFRAKLALTRQHNDQGEAIGLTARFTQIADNLSPDERRRFWHASIIDDSDEGILIVDRREEIVSVNAAFSRITGFTSGEVVGQSWHSSSRACMAITCTNSSIRPYTRAGAWHGEIVGKRKNGRTVPSVGIDRDGARQRQCRQPRFCHFFRHQRSARRRRADEAIGQL